MLRPYVWYDPHDVIKQLEFENWLLKEEHQIELNLIELNVTEQLKNYKERWVWSDEGYLV